MKIQHPEVVLYINNNIITNGKTINNIEMSYIQGITSPIQTQLNKSQMLFYWNQQTQIINQGSAKGFYFYPTATIGAYNNITQVGDNVIVSSDASSGTIGVALILTTWSEKSGCGIRNKIGHSKMV